MTYLVLNAAVLVAVVVCAVILLRWARPSSSERRELGRPLALTALVLVALTAVFDSALILTGVIAYDDAALVGVRVGRAPVEDFAYTLAVLALAPALWVAFGARRRRRRGDDAAPDGEVA